MSDQIVTRDWGQHVKSELEKLKVNEKARYEYSKTVVHPIIDELVRNKRFEGLYTASSRQEDRFVWIETVLDSVKDRKSVV